MFSNTVWAFVGLVIFLGVIGYVGGFGTLLKALDKRSQAIADELATAHKLREEAKALLAEYELKRKAAEKHAADIIASAKAEADRMTADAHSALAEMIERRTKAVEVKIAQAETAALAEVRSVAADVSIAAATRILGDKVQGDFAAGLLSKSIDEVKARLN